MFIDTHSTDSRTLWMTQTNRNLSSAAARPRVEKRQILLEDRGGRRTGALPSALLR